MVIAALSCRPGLRAATQSELGLSRRWYPSVIPPAAASCRYAIAGGHHVPVLRGLSVLPCAVADLARLNSRRGVLAGRARGPPVPVLARSMGRDFDGIAGLFVIGAVVAGRLSELLITRHPLSAANRLAPVKNPREGDLHLFRIAYAA